MQDGGERNLQRCVQLLKGNTIFIQGLYLIKLAEKINLNMKSQLKTEKLINKIRNVKVIENCKII